MTIRFDRYVVDTDRLELQRDGARVDIEPQVFSLLTYLIENRDRVVSKDELIEAVWQGRIVSDTTLNTRINAVRRSVGDDGKTQAIIRTIVRRGFRFVADIIAESPSQTSSDTRKESGYSQQVRFCTASDGVRIAYGTAGQGPPLVKTANWLNHLEYDWESPIWRPMLREFCSYASLIRYDERGNGLSDWDVEELSLDAFVADLEAVADAAGLERFSMFGMSQGSPVAVAYAVRHPERVAKLVLYGGFTKGARQRGAIDLHKEEAIATLIREGWGQDNPAFRQIFTSQMMPDASVEQAQWFNDLQRETTSPENAVKLRIAIDEIDIADLLPNLQTPTLVIHRRDDARQPFEEGRTLAAMIPNAQFVVLEGRNRIILEDEAEWPRFMAEVRNFVT